MNKPSQAIFDLNESYLKSGLSIVNYCKENNISKSKLIYARRAISNFERENNPNQETKNQFVEVKPKDDSIKIEIGKNKLEINLKKSDLISILKEML